MAEYESLIRDALEKHGTPNAAMRFNIYAAARQVVEQSFADLPPEVIERQRNILEQDIANIESGYINIAPPASEINASEIDALEINTSKIDTAKINAPEISTPKLNAPEIENPISADLSFDDFESATESSGKGYFKFLSTIFIIFAILAGGYFYYPAQFKVAQTYFLEVVESFIESYNSQTERKNNITRQPIKAFEPLENSANINTPGGSIAQFNLQNENPHVALLSLDSTNTSDIEISIAKNILSKLQTKSATFEFTVRANVSEQNFSIACSTGCKKQTFTATQDIKTFSLNVSVRSNEKNKIFIINSDLSGGGKMLELYSITARNNVR